MDKQRRNFISRMSSIAAITALGKPLMAIASVSDKIVAIDAAKKARAGSGTIALQDLFLDKELADALCTLIVLGYAKTTSNCTFQYDGSDADYKMVGQLLEAKGIKVKISASTPAKDFPFVVALNKKIYNTEVAKKALEGAYYEYLIRINNEANKPGKRPKGAYIGGLSTISKLSIVGPSRLDQYKPTYRTADDGTIKTSFDNAKKSTNDAIKALAAIARPMKSEVSHGDLNSLETASFSSGNLFKSYHGMIQAMINYKTNADTNSFIFEIAMGEETSKVSSCFPCSAYMTANGTPASSTHLGAGDNWNIPPGNDAAYKLWAGKIADWYKAGKGLFPNPDPGSKIKRLLDELGKKGRERDVHNIYLEALTFEGKFTDRIKSTFSKENAVPPKPNK